MNEMVERGAVAILAKVPLGYGMTKAEAIEYASAVIEIMREPTPEMLQAMEPWTKASGHQDLVWRAGIDQALK